MDEEDHQIKYLESFVDIKKINQLIDNLNQLQEDQASILKAEALFQNFSTILDEYQEQPHLIDPFLKDLISKLLNLIRDSNRLNSLAFHTSFKYLYHLSKVRGFKVIVRYLPHEVDDVEPVIHMINLQCNLKFDNWQTKYILLIWLSVLVLLPFHLERFDAIKGDHSLMEQIYKIILSNLCEPGKYSDACAYLAAKFLTRPEINQIYLERFIDWSIIQIDNNFNGPLLALSYIFKLGKREEVNKFGSKLFQKFASIEVLNENDFKLKLIVKLIQRIALSYLKTKIASWRYQRGKRFLVNNLNNDQLNKQQKINEFNSEQSSQLHKEEELVDFINLDEDKLEEISNIINFLLSSLKHRNIEVRWSASKGLGRITERLTKDLAEDIVDNLTELFSSYEEESTWHGACLSVAELARRGLILPDKLPVLVPLVSKALIYEELRGNYTSGKIVRDAACYISWAFARAFEPKVIRPFVDSIATTLVVVAVFDKEVIIRRAAAAAFQENVGRQGTFPNGIDIVTTVDHFSVQLINRSYLEISPQIAQYDAYKLPLIQHLIDHKIRHVDSNLRDLAARTLHNITLVVEDSIILEHALPKLFDLIKSASYKDRHGSILALASIVHAFYLKETKLDAAITDKIELIFLNLNNSSLKEQLTGLSGDFMKHALNVLIEKCALSKLEFKEKPKLIELWTSLIKKTLVHSDPKLRKYAIDALRPFCESYLSGDRSKQDELLAFLIVEIRNGTEEARLGALTALSNLPDSILEEDTPSILLNTILNLLAKGSLQNKNLALIRSKAIQSLKLFLINLDKAKLFGLADCIEEYLNYCMSEGVSDYTMNSMKDIGYYVRLQSVCALAELMIYFIQANLHGSLVKRNLLKILSSILPQCVSPNDMLRNKSSNCFYELVKICPSDSNELASLKEIFKDVKDEYTFKDYLTNFGLFVRVFDIDYFRMDLWKGYVLTTGGFEFSSVSFEINLIKFNQFNKILNYFLILIEKVNHSREALISYLKKASKDKILFENIQYSLYKLFIENSSNNRYPITIIKTYDYLFTTGIMDTLNSQLLNDILNAVWDQTKRSDEVVKITAGSILICSLLRYKGMCLTHCVNLKFIKNLIKFLFFSRSFPSKQNYTIIVLLN